MNIVTDFSIIYPGKLISLYNSSKKEVLHNGSKEGETGSDGPLLYQIVQALPALFQDMQCRMLASERGYALLLSMNKTKVGPQGFAHWTYGEK